MIDYRKTEKRRKVFLDFYEYHLKYYAHAGAVYYAFPYIFDQLKMNEEEKLWFVYINGCSQNVVTTYLIFKNFRDFHNLDEKELSKFFRANYERFGWDTDRRYVKNKFEECVASYKRVLNGEKQEEYFKRIGSSGDIYKNFDLIWEQVLENFDYFGRLATFSYLEYLRLAGINLDCSQLFLDDITGSKSHRNGICKVLGRDDLDWTKDNEVKYDSEMIRWLEKEGKSLMDEARAKITHKDLSYFTLETTLCCYKGWHRVNRRYPNVYNDMFYDRIRSAEKKWSEESFNIFWDARKKYLPCHLRLEDNILDKGLSKPKQNHYRLTGEVIMMENEGYKTGKRTWYRNCVLLIGACGSGKTWVMKQLLKGKTQKRYKLGKFCFHETDEAIIVGKYDGTIFEGSDKLSMAVMADLGKMLEYISKKDKLTIFEGDRFTNGKFIERCDPAIIKITDDGTEGRKKRGSSQTERHLKSIATRVRNITPHKTVENSTEALTAIKSLIETNQENNDR